MKIRRTTMEDRNERAPAAPRRRRFAAWRTPVLMLLLGVCVLAWGCKNKDPEPLSCPVSTPSPAAIFGCAAPTRHGAVQAGFHGGGARLGWDDQEPELTAAQVGGGHFGLLWTSAPFDTCAGYPGRMYASPLYADDVTIHGGEFDGATLSVVFAATSHGAVYALNAFSVACVRGNVAAGAVLWKTQLVAPSVVLGLDGGVPVGTLSTPAFDSGTSRLYVAAMDRPKAGLPVWKVFALDASSGAPLPGWPVAIDAAAVEPLNTNAPQSWEPDATQLAQRSALLLSPSGDRLYVAFGGYNDSVTGWIVSIDTAGAKVAAAFSSAHDARLGAPNGGLWGAGGAAVDIDGTVFMTTGNSPGSAGVTGNWGDSLLAWGTDLSLRGTYSPWNYCQDDDNDVDIGGDSPVLPPDQSASGTSTPRLVAFGSKQGNVYLLERDALPGTRVSRMACSAESRWPAASSSDHSLLPAAGKPYCDPQQPTQCVRGPLSVFGPYSDAQNANERDRAKMRSTLAYFSDSSGAAYLFASGTTKGSDGTTPVPPSVARLALRLSPGTPASLALDAVNKDLSLVNPGSPVVTSAAGREPVVWIVDENAQRSRPLIGPSASPVLYAVDGKTMALLFRSGANDLTPGGKYVTPAIAHGTVFVGTDRLQAFGVRP